MFRPLVEIFNVVFITMFTKNGLYSACSIPHQTKQSINYIYVNLQRFPQCFCCIFTSPHKMGYQL